MSAAWLRFAVRMRWAGNTVTWQPLLPVVWFFVICVAIFAVALCVWLIAYSGRLAPRDLDAWSDPERSQDR